ncbi:MAG: efflux RND transporter periplasmic adaptor subunit [Desulfobacterales bacterium]
MNENARSKKRDGIYGILQLAFVIVFVGGAFLVTRYLASIESAPNPDRGAGQREMLVETARVAPASHRLRFSSTGTVQVRAVTDLVPQVSGRVVSIDDSAFPGGLFTPDTVLFQIDKTDYRLNVEQIKAEVARAETQVELSEARSSASVEEWRRLNPNTPVPHLVAEKPQLAEAKAALEAAGARLKIARLNLSRTDFKLPFTGRMTEFHLEVGQYVVVGQSYGKAYRIFSLEIDLPLEEEQLTWLLESEDPIITVVSGYMEQDTYSAFVKRISGKVEPQTRLARAVLGIKDPMPDLVPDVFVKVNIIGPERRNIWVLPLNALQENRSVWEVTSENTLRQLQPNIIQITEEAVVAESDGRAITVVRGNIPEATEGTRVRPVNTQEN